LANPPGENFGYTKHTHILLEVGAFTPAPLHPSQAHTLLRNISVVNQSLLLRANAKYSLSFASTRN